MYSLNSALIQMTMRRMILAGPQGFPDVLQEQRISSRDVMWLHLLNRRKLEALDRLPISLFRISYDRLDVGRGGLDDDLFERTCIRLTMVTETINFAITNKTNPLISIGFDNEGFDRFRHEPFLRRLMMIQKGGFKVGLRCDLASLELMPDNPEAQLSDCLRIILGELKHQRANGGKRMGSVRDWNAELTSGDVVAERLLKDGVTPKLVTAHVGLPERVNSLHRKLRRENRVGPKGGGRIGSHSSSIERMPRHALLFMSIYLLLAKNPETRINALVFSLALNEYRLIWSYLNFSEADTLDASECWLLASGYRSQEVSVVECSSCRQIKIQDRRKASTCHWC